MWLSGMADDQIPLLLSLNQAAPRGLTDLGGLTILKSSKVKSQFLRLNSAQARPCGWDARRGAMYAPILTSYGDTIPNLRRVQNVYTLDGLAQWVEDQCSLQIEGLELLIPLSEARMEPDIDSSWFEIPWELPGEIVCIRHEGQVYLPGSDFLQQGSRLVLLDTAAHLLGERLEILTRHVKNDGRAYVAGYSEAVEEAIAVRRGNTLRRLEAFVATACKLLVVPEDSILRSVSPTPQGCRIVSDNWEGFIASPRDHPEAGRVVRAGEKLGGTFDILHQGGAWWKTENWDLGLPLDALWPVPGVSTNNSPIQITRAADKLRIEGLQGTPSALSSLSAWLSQAQNTHAGLAESLQLEDGDSLNMAALDFFFGHVLGAGKVVVLRYEQRFSAAARFVRAHLPLNCIVFHYVLP